ncbi:hypothetical protein D6K50_20940 [Salmonella enterica subsp. enterica serovar Oranienburg]|uniref:Uncharacterized protein n=1 Tax=Salmonella enterica TaxID=28901 RepID=A0A5T4T431_SALER|nr:hypothetical protein [Salmonella enterica]EBV3720638.1 hypothetical protein [Salmonella enterica subsp. enterica serovar Oranienburg]EBY7704316.1 hypothetical protein [Salmonella enterica subsp. enterica serovar Oranienburg]ECY5283425.1 hypothetical protein [Salmonella enterica subsp. enterica serovar Oranienburg]
MAGADLRLAAECYGDMDSYAMYTCLRTSLRISLRIHHNGESTLGEPVDWAMIPLQANALTCCVGVHTRIRTWPVLLIISFTFSHTHPDISERFH